MESSNPKRGFTTKEAAAYLGESVSGLRDLKANNRIAARQRERGAKVIYLREDLDSYLNSMPQALNEQVA